MQHVERKKLILGSETLENTIMKAKKCTNLLPKVFVTRKWHKKKKKKKKREKEKKKIGHG